MSETSGVECKGARQTSGSGGEPQARALVAAVITEDITERADMR